MSDSKLESTNVFAKVYLVGAGPGDPGLITLRGVECLQQADVVLYDYLVNPVIAQHAPANAELICLGRHGRSRIWKQSEINQRLLDLARSGKTVVRLKGGDPAVFARGGEEVAFLQAHGVPLEIVPGITAALAAGSHAGIPITHRDLASAVALVTGHEQDGKSPAGLDFSALARFPGTLVFYMGVTTVAHWSSALMQHGMAADTPVAVVRRCSLPDQRTIHCRLDEVAKELTPYSKFPPPVIVIVGPVAGRRDIQNWFEQRPLFGCTVLVTRPIEQAPRLGRLLTEQGARVIYQPAIAIGPPADWQPVNDAIGKLQNYDWVVFASVNGVNYFLDHLLASDRDLRLLGSVKLASIGPATTAALADRQLRADVQPAEFRAEALAAELVDQAEGKNFLLVRASRGRDVLAAGLKGAGALVDEVVAYQSADVTQIDPETLQAIDAGQVDWVTVTSSAIARALVGLLGRARLQRIKVASISPVTTATLRELGVSPTVEATTYTMKGVATAIVEAEPRRQI